MRNLEATAIPDDEAWDVMRADIVALLSQDPHCPLANLIGQALADVEI